MVSLVYFYPYYKTEETRVSETHLSDVASGHASLIQIFEFVLDGEYEFALLFLFLLPCWH